MSYERCLSVPSVSKQASIAGNVLPGALCLVAPAGATRCTLYVGTTEGQLAGFGLIPGDCGALVRGSEFSGMGTVCCVFTCTLAGASCLAVVSMEGVLHVFDVDDDMGRLRRRRPKTVDSSGIAQRVPRNVCCATSVMFPPTTSVVTVVAPTPAHPSSSAAASPPMSFSSSVGAAAAAGTSPSSSSSSSSSMSVTTTTTTGIAAPPPLPPGPTSVLLLANATHLRAYGMEMWDSRGVQHLWTVTMAGITRSLAYFVDAPGAEPLIVAGLHEGIVMAVSVAGVAVDVAYLSDLVVGSAKEQEEEDEDNDDSGPVGAGARVGRLDALPLPPAVSCIKTPTTAPPCE